MMSEEERDFTVSPMQGAQLMCLAEMIRTGDLAFRGHEPEDEESATALILDVAQEIALQVPHGK